MHPSSEEREQVKATVNKDRAPEIIGRQSLSIGSSIVQEVGGRIHHVAFKHQIKTIITNRSTTTAHYQKIVDSRLCNLVELINSLTGII